MKIGIICGKTGEEVLDKQLLKTIPKKYKLEGNIHTDVGLAYVIKNKFPDVDVDVIMPKDISNARLQKNDINIPIGYDLINAINDDPYIKKFHGKEGIDRLDKIFQSKKILCHFYGTKRNIYNICKNTRSPLVQLFLLKIQ